MCESETCHICDCYPCACGSNDFRSPEQVRDDHKRSADNDAWAFGFGDDDP